MTDMLRRYTRSSFPALVYCGTTRAINGIIRDEDSWEEFSEETIASYISEGSDMLIASLAVFLKPETPYSSLRAKELRFMLEALIEVKEVFTAEHLPIIHREV